MIRKSLVVLTLLALSVLVLSGIAAQDDMMEDTSFTVTIENISAPASTTEVFNTPVGEEEPGPALPGTAYAFSFTADPGQYLSFTTMLVQSNDLFFAPDPAGIALYDMDGAPLQGDITDLVLLWDAGTEVNEEPGVGENQAPRQSGPDTGDDENGTVELIDNIDDMYSYPAVADTIAVNLAYEDGTFTLTVENVSGDSELATPLAPGVFAVHGPFNFLFAEHVAASAGIEAMAEDGNAAILAEEATAFRLASPLAPGVFAVHSPDVALFTAGDAPSAGLEALAEDGNAGILADEIGMGEGILSSGVFNTPVGAGEPGPAFPGDVYEFSFSASAGDYLSFATMLVQSNDLFFAPDPAGIALFDMDGSPVEGDVTMLVPLWDAGSEVNEEPGVGENQAPRQSGPNTGDDEMGTVTLIDEVDDMYQYPASKKAIRVTIHVDDM